MINMLNSLKNTVLEFCQNAPLLITLTKNGTIKVLEYLFTRLQILDAYVYFYLFVVLVAQKAC
jgi:hypothetical protein